MANTRPSVYRLWFQMLDPFHSICNNLIKLVICDIITCRNSDDNENGLTSKEEKKNCFGPGNTVCVYNIKFPQ